VAAQAGLTVDRQFFFGLGEMVRIVAGDAAQLAVAGVKAFAGEHLLDVAYRLVAARLFGRFKKHRPE